MFHCEVNGRLSWGGTMKKLTITTAMIVAFSALPAWAQNGGVSSSEIANAAAASSAGEGILVLIFILSVIGAALGGNGTTAPLPL